MPRPRANLTSQGHGRALPTSDMPRLRRPFISASGPSFEMTGKFLFVFPSLFSSVPWYPTVTHGGLEQRSSCLLPARGVLGGDAHRKMPVRTGLRRQPLGDDSAIRSTLPPTGGPASPDWAFLKGLEVTGNPLTTTLINSYFFLNLSRFPFRQTGGFRIPSTELRFARRETTVNSSHRRYSSLYSRFRSPTETGKATPLPIGRARSLATFSRANWYSLASPR